VGQSLFVLLCGEEHMHVVCSGCPAVFCLQRHPCLGDRFVFIVAGGCLDQLLQAGAGTCEWLRAAQSPGRRTPTWRSLDT
jgi:hypothetical protein